MVVLGIVLRLSLCFLWTITWPSIIYMLLLIPRPRIERRSASRYHKLLEHYRKIFAENGFEQTKSIWLKAVLFTKLEDLFFNLFDFDFQYLLVIGLGTDWLKEGLHRLSLFVDSSLDVVNFCFWLRQYLLLVLHKAMVRLFIQFMSYIFIVYNLWWS